MEEKKVEITEEEGGASVVADTDEKGEQDTSVEVEPDRTTVKIEK